jgi:hypothetical protein
MEVFWKAVVKKITPMNAGSEVGLSTVSNRYNKIIAGINFPLKYLLRAFFLRKGTWAILSPPTSLNTTSENMYANFRSQKTEKKRWIFINCLYSPITFSNQFRCSAGVFLLTARMAVCGSYKIKVYYYKSCYSLYLVHSLHCYSQCHTGVHFTALLVAYRNLSGVAI